MGTDLSSNFCFGIPSTEDFNIDDRIQGRTEDDYGSHNDDREWESIYFEKKTGRKEPDYETQKPEWEQWLRDKHEATRGLPIVLELSGYDGELQYHIAIRETVKVSDWGDAVKIDSLEVKPEWIEAIKDFCKVMEIEYKEPCWFMTSLWF